jgi:hypothetical protein
MYLSGKERPDVREVAGEPANKLHRVYTSCHRLICMRTLPEGG